MYDKVTYLLLVLFKKIKKNMHKLKKTFEKNTHTGLNNEV